jgi:hypothetical protein
LKSGKILIGFGNEKKGWQWVFIMKIAKLINFKVGRKEEY